MALSWQTPICQGLNFPAEAATNPVARVYVAAPVRCLRGPPGRCLRPRAGGSCWPVLPRDPTGLTRALSGALAPWRKPLASHDPARSWPIWRSHWRSVGTVWLMWRCCAPRRDCSVVWPPIPRCPGLITTLAADAPEARSHRVLPRTRSRSGVGGRRERSRLWHRRRRTAGHRPRRHSGDRTFGQRISRSDL